MMSAIANRRFTPAFAKAKGDYSACVVLLIRKEIVYILEVVRGRFSFEALKKKVMELKRRYNPSTLLIEDSPISLGLIKVCASNPSTSRPISPTPTSALD
jgi:phage terminase large subunit-like protein